MSSASSRSRSAIDDRAVHDPASDGDLVEDLIAEIGADAVHADGASNRLYRRDASLYEAGKPGPVCFPTSTTQTQACVRVARRHGRSFVARGSGTGLAGGAVPLNEPVIISTTRMRRVLDFDPADRAVWVEPGVINLDLSRQVAHHGLHFAPDPSSQQACSIGGNVANNSGGPHCLAAGVTSAHVLAIEVVLPDGEVVVLGGEDPEPDGYDLRGLFIGSEGTMGIATKMLVRLTPNPPAVTTLLLDFMSVKAAAEAVTGIIAAGVIPAALEMMDQRITCAAEDFVGAGYPRDAAAILLVELDGMADGVAAETELVRTIGGANGARTVRVAADEAERELLWKGRKTAFGAISRISPDYYLHDTVVPRTRLVDVLETIAEIADEHDLIVMNVFHAGDGNLHPLLSFDAREPGVLDRVHAAGAAILAASLAAGGVLSGEHGIGVEKIGFMAQMYTDADLGAQAAARSVFDPDGVANPHKVLPSGSTCGDLMGIDELPEGTWM